MARSGELDSTATNILPLKLAIPLSLAAVAYSAETMPSEEEFIELADDLEANPPPNLSPDGLAGVLQILRDL